MASRFAPLVGKMDWKRPYFVLDQNMFRRVREVGEICVEKQLGLIVPDRAFHEFGKTLPYETANRSLAPLVKYRDRVGASKGVDEMINAEITSGNPVESLVHLGNSCWLQGLLERLEEGDEQSLREFMCSEHAVAKRREVAAARDGEQIKQALITHCRIIRDQLTDDELKNLRSGTQPPASIWLCSEGAQEQVTSSIAHLYKTPLAIAQRLATTPTITAAFLRAMFAWAVDWLAFNGLESISGDKINNDLDDIEYVTLAALCDGFATKDKRAKRLSDSVSYATGHWMS